MAYQSENHMTTITLLHNNQRPRLRREVRKEINMCEIITRQPIRSLEKGRRRER